MTSVTGEYQIGARDVRPWGSWEVLAVGPGFAVKRLVVNAGQLISLQSHEHRSEHWIVLRGQARVTIEDTVTELGPDAAVFIPRRAKHRIENIGSQALALIEVQTGTLLQESDLRRFDDRYGRA